MVKKKICFYLKKLDGGGAERVLISYLKELESKNYDVSLFILIKTGVLIDEIPSYVKCRYGFLGNEYKKSKIYRIYRRLALNILLRYKFLINIFFLNQEVDVEIAFLQDFSSTIHYSRNPKSKKIIWIHNNIEKIRSISKGELLRNLKNADRIITVSKGLKQLITKYNHELETKINVIYNPIDRDEIISNASKENIKLDGFSFITMGRLTEQKSYDLLIKSFKILSDEYKSIKLFILGKGPMEKELNNLITELNLKNRVELLGFKKNPFSYVKAADVFVLSSKYEGLSNVIIEALCLEKPVISTDCPFGPKEVLNSGQNGLLVESESVRSLADGMKKIYNDVELRERFIDKSIERSRKFSPDIVVSQFIDIMEQLWVK